MCNLYTFFSPVVTYSLKNTVCLHSCLCRRGRCAVSSARRCIRPLRGLRVRRPGRRPPAAGARRGRQRGQKHRTHAHSPSGSQRTPGVNAPRSKRGPTPGPFAGNAAMLLCVPQSSAAADSRHVQGRGQRERDEPSALRRCRRTLAVPEGEPPLSFVFSPPRLLQTASRFTLSGLAGCGLRPQLHAPPLGQTELRRREEVGALFCGVQQRCDVHGAAARGRGHDQSGPS